MDLIQYAAGGCRILVVDAYRDVADTLVMLLGCWGYQASAAYDGPTALSQLAELAPDVVLLDLVLPKCDGFAVAAAIMHLPPPTPLIVAWTGYGRDVDRIRTHAAGFHAHLLKTDLEELQFLLGRYQRPVNAQRVPA